MKKLLLGFLSLVIILLIGKTVKAEVYGSMSGKVTTKEGVPVEGVVINWCNYGNAAEMLEMEKKGISSINKRSVTDKNGFYKIDKLVPAKYYIYLGLEIILPKEYSLYKVTKMPNMPVELLKGRNLTDVNFEISRYYGTISGKVYKSDGVTPYKVGVVILKEDNEPLSGGSDSSGVFKFDEYTPCGGGSRIMLNFYDDKYCYVSDIIIDLSQPRDITNLNVIAGEMPLTGFFGVVKNLDGTIFSKGSVRVRSTKWNLLQNDGFINEQGYYQIRGMIPEEYKIIIRPLDEKPDEIKNMTLDSTFSIKNIGEQKEINLIYDESKCKIEKMQLRRGFQF